MESFVSRNSEFFMMNILETKAGDFSAEPSRLSAILTKSKKAGFHIAFLKNKQK